MYGSAQWLIPPWSTFSMRATRKISGWGHVTENTPCTMGVTMDMLEQIKYVLVDLNMKLKPHWCRIVVELHKKNKHNGFFLVVVFFSFFTCLGYCMAVSGTPWTNRCPSGWTSPPPLIYWLLLLGTMPLTDGWLRSTCKSEEIFLPFWMSNSDRVT